MTWDDLSDRFEQLSQRYDEQHGAGATLRLKDELGLGGRLFNEELTILELRTLLQEIEARFTSE